ncbi:hypothetical protein H2203_001683 [Taxawa tesnikishii (nom. ined.)]|nr:hypothetical protein H2203_001683 [Dothideales sp. JES 119]
MCRWFAYISPSEPCLLSDVLITPAHSLTHQVHEHYLPKLFAHSPRNITTEHEVSARNRLFNVDGLGVSWYTTSFSDFELGSTGQSADGGQREGLRPAVYKTVQPPSGDLNFRSLAQNTETRCCFAHIRAASATPIVQVNNHPFLFGRFCFMHNGVVSDFSKIRREVCQLLDEDAYSNVLGSTDSEHVAALSIHYLSSGRGRESWEDEYEVRSMATALHKAVETVISLQKKVLGDKARPNSLNLCVTDGTKLVAYRFRNHAVEQPPSLYYSNKAGVTLNRKYPDHPDGIELSRGSGSRKKAEEHGAHVIVASEPSTYREQDWDLIGKNQCLTVDISGALVLEDVPYDKTWDAEEP